MGVKRANIKLGKYFPVYSITTPRSISGTGKPLLSPRVISNEIFQTPHPGKPTPKDQKLSLMTFSWGQFMIHDVVLTPVSTDENGEDLDCCDEDADHVDCLPIRIPLIDPHFQGRQTCMSFSRSIPAESYDGCAPGHREQINRLTSFIDGGTLYGDSLLSHALLNAPNGLLNTTKYNLLPPGGVCKTFTNNRDHCPLAGDERVSENPALGGMHVIWVRQHNHIAQRLAKITSWSSYKIFQETRKIIGAMLQFITYKHYLPKILSPKTLARRKLSLRESGYESRYDQETDPSVKNVVASAVFRFGHSQIPPELGYLFRDMTSRTFRLEDTFLDPHLVVTQRGVYLPDLVRFVLRNSSRLVDRQIESAVRNTLFIDQKGLSFDLGAFNIQRGRDHGLPPYAEWRKHCGLNVPSTFGQLVDHDIHTREKLSNVYELVTDIDVFVGGISELPEEGSILGPLFNCLIGKQFHDLKFGDRYWFENPGIGGFTTNQLKAIRSVTLASVICSVLDVGEIQKDAFEIPHKGNPLVSCKKIPKLDLDPWKE
uniref:Peroxidase-like protein 3 n=1 Tax=Crassostrea virginica TaxID=6565 RepID=A0A8B8BXH1_CRAVI|nr:peroxidase-like protein 3 [Crassostrea virginica]